MNRFLFSVLLLLYSACSCAQQYMVHTKHYGAEQGLAHRSVKCVVQDNKGYIWIATDNGIDRFDGTEFKHYNKSNAALSYNDPRDIFAAPDGKLWLFYNYINTVRGADIFDPATGKAVPFQQYFSHKLPAGFKPFTYGYATDAKGNIYIGSSTHTGFATYHPHSGFKFTAIADTGVFLPMLTDNIGQLWGHIVDVNTQPVKTLCINSSTGAILKVFPPLVLLPSKHKHCANGALMYATVSDEKLKVYDGRLAWLSSHFKNGSILSYIDGAQNILLTERCIYDVRNKKQLLNLSEAIPSFNVATHPIASWCVDNAGDLWIATDFGLTHISVKPSLFQQYLFTGNSSEKDLSIRGILPRADGSILINTENSLQLRLWPATGKTDVINKSDTADIFYALAEDKSGNTYSVNSYNPVLSKTDASGVITTYGKGTMKPLWKILFLDKNRFWGASVNNTGIIAGDLRRPNLVYSISYNGFTELKEMPVNNLMHTADGTIWIHSEGGGVYKASETKGVLERYWPGGKGKRYLPCENVLHGYQDKDGVWWLATADKGLVRWIPESGEAEVYDMNDGLPCQTVYAVYEDKRGSLWLPSDKGLLQFDKVKRKLLHIYLASHGVTHNEFNRIAHAQAKDGTLYFGGLNGITAFNPDNFYSKELAYAAPLVLIKCLKYDGKSGDVNDITALINDDNAITLQPNDGFISLDVALLSYNGIQDIKYAYRFNESSDWVFQSSSKIQLAGLPYGKHTIYIKGLSANGLESSNVLAFTIQQLKPVYLRTWFLLLLLLLVLICAALYTRYRTRSLRMRQKQIEHEVKVATVHIAEQADEIAHLSNLKTRFFTNVSHELRTPLTLIKGPINSVLNSGSLSEEQAKQLATADYHAKQLHGLINELLDLSKLEAGKMQLQQSTVSLQPFISYIISAFDSHAVQQQVKLIFNYGIQRRLHISTDADKLTKIINNLLSNAIKFTPIGGTVTVDVEERNGNLLLSVSDTGIGIHPDDQAHVFERFYQTAQSNAPYTGGTGVGLTISYEFAQLLGGTISLNSQLGKGSVFSLSIPIMETVAEEELIDTATVEDLTTLPVHTHYNILVVEDNPAMQDYVRQVLNKHYTVHTANNGSQALEWLSANKLPDLIVSDIMMPVMDGFELLGKLKASDKYRHLPVVMLTARAEIQDKLQALRIGVDDYLLKPFDEQELLARIANLLNNYTQRSQSVVNTAQEFVAEGEADAGSTSTINITESEQQWLGKVEALVQNGLQNAELSVEYLAKELDTSRSTFLRQLKRLTGLTPTQYIDEIRFSTARRLLENREVDSVKATAYSVGFTQVEHFSRMFHKRYGKYPSAYLT